MSYADKIFKSNIEEILRYGTVTDTEEARAHWEDGKPAYTIKKFGIVNTYDLAMEFPIMTLRPTNIRAAFDELLWIWQKKSNNIKDLHSHIWDSWADKKGSIGRAYGYQIGKTYVHHIDELDENSEEKYSELQRLYPSLEVIPCGKNQAKIYLDQIDGVLYDLRTNPFSRRIMTNIYNFDDLYLMNLYPCAYSMTFNVTKTIDGTLMLNGILNQRSQDMIVANNWNVVQYALLLKMIAQCVGMHAGKLIHVISDAHIYDRHVRIAEAMKRRPISPKKAQIYLNPNITDFYEFTVDDLIVRDYEPCSQIKNIPVAI